MPDVRWSERLIAYASASAASSAVGCLFGVFLYATTSQGRIGSLALFSVGGFVLGLLAGPIIGHFAPPQPSAPSAADTAEEFTRAAALGRVARQLFPYAFACALGSTLGCSGGIALFALTRGTLGPLALLSGGGFLLGSLAGVLYAIFFSSSFPTLGTRPVVNAPSVQGGGVLTAEAG